MGVFVSGKSQGILGKNIYGWLKPTPDARAMRRGRARSGPHGFTRIAYVEWGPPDAEQVVLCVHGLTRNARDFDFLARRLAARGMRVVAPDLPGPRPQRLGRERPRTTRRRSTSPRRPR